MNSHPNELPPAEPASMTEADAPNAQAVASMPIEQLKAILEAALLASSQPMSLQHLGDLFADEEQVDRAQISMALEALGQDCAGRGVELLEVASGFRYQVRREVHPWISRMWTEKPSRYSRALLETLSLIAYRQPITRPEIEQIRGVVVSSNIIKTLEEREWIRVVGYRDVPGKPALFGTTRTFLDYFSLKSLDELPPLSAIRDLEDPQMQLDQNPLPARIVRDLPIDPDHEEISEHEEAIDDADSEESAEHPAEHATAAGESDESSTESDAREHDESAPAAPPTATADEAANRADPEADHGPDEAEPDLTGQDTEEHRA
jgi:segregation and condensation protein B